MTTDASLKSAARAYVDEHLQALCREILDIENKKNDPSKAVYTQALNAAVHARKLRDLCAAYIGDFAAFNEVLRLVHTAAMTAVSANL